MIGVFIIFRLLRKLAMTWFMTFAGEVWLAAQLPAKPPLTTDYFVIANEVKQSFRILILYCTKIIFHL
jgi:hypothetical protein